MKISNDHFHFLLIALLGMTVVFLSPYILPARFFYDAHAIINNPSNLIGVKGSYPFTIWFYKVTGLKHFSFQVIGIIQYSIFIGIVYKLGIPYRFYNIIGLENILIYFFILISAVYLSMPTKEFINFLYFTPLIFITKNRLFKLKSTIFLLLISIIFFGYFFRPYYQVIPILMVMIHYGSKIKIKNKALYAVFYGLTLMIFISLSYGVIKGKYISDKARTEVNQIRLNSKDANSIIVPPLETDTWYGEAVSILYGFFSVNLPVNGLKFYLKPQILLFVCWQLLLIVILYFKTDRCFSQGRKGNYELWLGYFLISYFILQGVFEPDLGSVIRHKVGIFLIIYYFVYHDKLIKRQASRILEKH